MTSNEAAVLSRSRSPLHVVYGGADRFSAETPRKLGDLALRAADEYAPDFAAFARALGLPHVDSLPDEPGAIGELDSGIAADPKIARSENHAAWFAWTVFRKTVDKLKREPVEDFRIDFEDGYGFRPDAEEDRDTVQAAEQLGLSLNAGSITPFCGFRIKSFGSETHVRSNRTLDLFLDVLLETTNGAVPSNFVVTLPKVKQNSEVRSLSRSLKRIEKRHGLEPNSIGIEVMIETPDAIFDKSGKIALRGLISAARGRCNSVHFGAFDYTSALGIAAQHQDLNHPACEFARQIMLSTLVPIGIRVSDSVTTLLPVPLHRDGKLSESQKQENLQAVYEGWQVHFANVSRSMANGFYQSWDLHPNQLVARYAAVYAFFLTGSYEQSDRLRRFIDAATRARLTGNVFDDAASAQGILNYFRRGLDCGAFTDDEVVELTGLSIDEIQTSFQEINASRGIGK